MSNSAAGSNADRFSGRVQEYERYRLGYPAEVLDLLREHCGLRANDVIADVGAGTGMVARLFLEAGNPVIALEPNAEMREACARALGGYAGFRAVDATAEATGLRTGSVDMVSVGRAFHWFDQPRALREFGRILRPGGWVVVLANRRQHGGSAQAEEFEALLMEYGNDYARVREGYSSYVDLHPYGDGKVFKARMPGEEELSIEQFLGQARSYSMVPLAGQPRDAAMQAALHAFFARWNTGGRLRVATECSVVAWQTRRR